MFDDLFQHLNDILQLFFPGYVFILTVNYFTRKSNSYEFTVVGSVLISYFIQLICKLINSYLNWAEVVISIISIVLGFLLALAYVKIRLTSIYKKASIFLGRETGDKSIWEMLFDKKLGANVRFFTKFNNMDVEVFGTVKYYDVNSNSQCDIAIYNYTIKYQDGSLYKPDSNNILFYINSESIHGLEVSPGKGKKSD